MGAKGVRPGQHSRDPKSYHIRGNADNGADFSVFRLPHMARVAIVTDASADLAPETRASSSITVVPVTLTAIRGRAPALQHLEGQPKAPPAALVDAFAATFSGLASDHDAIVAVLLSGRLGAIVDAARLARERLARVLPIEIVDSRSASL